jgi:hypothetical protein
MTLQSCTSDLDVVAEDKVPTQKNYLQQPQV